MIYEATGVFTILIPPIVMMLAITQAIGHRRHTSHLVAGESHHQGPTAPASASGAHPPHADLHRDHICDGVGEDQALVTM